VARLRISDISDTAAEALRNAGAFVGELAAPTLRLGVTGLARAGKTVFITALVRNLVTGGRLPFFTPFAQGRITRAYLEPQPDDAVPRFAYEEHLARLAEDPPRWPESTRRISQLRVTIEFAPLSRLKRTFGRRELHLDIVDYPGEWLIDLPLLDLTFAQWSREALARANDAQRTRISEPWRAFAATLDGNCAADEAIAIKGAHLFTTYLKSARDADQMPSTVGPGRFLMPGDLAGSPLVTFFPLPMAANSAGARFSLAALLERRYESYKSHVVRPFFRDHFSRLHRQIVLVDALAALNGGPAALQDLERAMATILACFRAGTNTWLSSILARRVDRLLFAATKADHLHHTAHDRLEALLACVVDKAMARARFAGADVKVLALAAMRATREAQVKSGAEPLPCIVGIPMAGEKLDHTIFNGKIQVVVFPGDLPADATALVRGRVDPTPIRVLCFQPPRMTLELDNGEASQLAHIRLDRALDFLMGDKLA
jgi:predicted YcjX-like family ATPase